MQPTREKQGQVVDPKLSQFAPGVLIPGTPYEAVMLLGVGGMGSVYEVRHRVLGRKFVLKALHGQLASRRDLVARMANEWRTLGALAHKNIVSVTDAGFTSDGVPYYVMERLEGETLADLLRREGRLEPRRAAALALDILDGLAAAHGIFAIHRDIKPQNIFISGNSAKLLDFGVAKLRDKPSRVVTAAGLTIGTPRYMSPEQAAGHEIDARSDIYATGLVFFEMLTGKSPFAHIKDPHELVLAHMSEEPARADWVRPELPAELADLTQRFLAKEPSARPHNAILALKELKALIGGLPLPAEVTHVTTGGQYEADTVGPGAQLLQPAGASAQMGHSSRLASGHPPSDPALAPTESVLRAPVQPRAARADRPSDETHQVMPAVMRGEVPAVPRKGRPLLLAALGAAFLTAALAATVALRGGRGFVGPAALDPSPGPSPSLEPAALPAEPPVLVRSDEPPKPLEVAEPPVGPSRGPSPAAPSPAAPSPAAPSPAAPSRISAPTAPSVPSPARRPDPFAPRSAPSPKATQSKVPPEPGSPKAGLPESGL